MTHRVLANNRKSP